MAARLLLAASLAVAGAVDSSAAALAQLTAEDLRFLFGGQT